VDLGEGRCSEQRDWHGYGTEGGGDAVQAERVRVSMKRGVGAGAMAAAHRQYDATCHVLSCPAAMHMQSADQNHSRTIALLFTNFAVHATNNVL
jgi:hypothetical protein